MLWRLQPPFIRLMELQGNIRVLARVRPMLEASPVLLCARFRFLDIEFDGVNRFFFRASDVTPSTALWDRDLRSLRTHAYLAAASQPVGRDEVDHSWGKKFIGMDMKRVASDLLF